MGYLVQAVFVAVSRPGETQPKVGTLVISGYR